MNYIEGINHHTKAINILQRHFGEKSITGITIGTAEGLLEMSLLLYLPNLMMLYTIDPCLFVSGTQFEASVNDQAWHDDRYNQAVKALAEYPGRYTHLRITSDEAVGITPDNVDFCWVDGDHSPEQITKDVANYYPKVKSEGIFGGHDWDKAIQIVKRDLKEDVTLGVDLTWWLIKI
jgi:hypothetical protein